MQRKPEIMKSWTNIPAW